MGPSGTGRSRGRGGEGGRGLLALALVRPWGNWFRAGGCCSVPRGPVLLLVYGGLNVAAAALVLSGVIKPRRRVDRTALRWHLGVWDPWFVHRTELICRSDEPAGVLETAGLLPCGSGVTRRKTCSGVPSGAGSVFEASARCTRAGETGSCYVTESAMACLAGSSFQLVSAAPVIARSVAYRCR